VRFPATRTRGVNHKAIRTAAAPVKIVPPHRARRLDSQLLFDTFRMMEPTLEITVDQLSALAQPHRLALFRLLVVAGQAGRLAGDIAGELGIPPSSLSFHLAHLKRARLVSAVQRGRHRRYFADFAAMAGLIAFLTENCCSGAACQTRPMPERTAA